MAGRALPLLPSLEALDTRVAERTRATREAHPWWPCASGCDHCCRSLPHLPTISAPEWQRLDEAIARLPDAEVVRARIRTTPETRPVTCPLLDRDRGTCLVYEARPVACRTYGFYTERDAGLHCAKVTEAAIACTDAIVWGNGEAIADDLRSFGEVRSLRDWIDK